MATSATWLCCLQGLPEYLHLIIMPIPGTSNVIIQQTHVFDVLCNFRGFTHYIMCIPIWMDMNDLFYDSAQDHVSLRLFESWILGWLIPAISQSLRGSKFIFSEKHKTSRVLSQTNRHPSLLLTLNMSSFNISAPRSKSHEFNNAVVTFVVVECWLQNFANVVTVVLYKQAYSVQRNWTFTVWCDLWLSAWCVFILKCQALVIKCHFVNNSDHLSVRQWFPICRWLDPNICKVRTKTGTFVGSEELSRKW